MPKQHVVVVGAGIGGLTAALELAAAGFSVDVFESADSPGGKMREVSINNVRLDAGPTVFTMPWVFEELFQSIGTTLSDHLRLQPATILARHWWDTAATGNSLDLYADLNRSAEAIGDFAGAAEAHRFRKFTQHAKRIYETLEYPFIRSPKPNPLSLVSRTGLSKLTDLWSIAPFTSLWQTLGHYFHDPRLRQLFGRYATYCGSSPFNAPTTLMLVAHVEQTGVWLIEGGMHRLAEVLSEQAITRGARFHYNATVKKINSEHKRVSAVTLASGERFETDAIVLNADPAALANGFFGAEASKAVTGAPAAARSLSAVTWNLLAPSSGLPLLRHNVFFSANYAAEFDDIFQRKRLPHAPTVYICAQDRNAQDDHSLSGAERLLCLINAPSTGDTHAFDAAEIALCEQQTFDLLTRCGLQIQRQTATTQMTTPADFNRLFPATGGALYGPASHGWKASFRRTGSRSRMAGLYLAGGSTHPGPGVPMAVLSGRLAVASLLQDLGLM